VCSSTRLSTRWKFYERATSAAESRGSAKCSTTCSHRALLEEGARTLLEARSWSWFWAVGDAACFNLNRLR
jgi:hypothetical protein